MDNFEARIGAEYSNQLAGVLAWFIPILVLGLYLVLVPVLKNIRWRQTNLAAVLTGIMVVIYGLILCDFVGGYIFGFQFCAYGCSETTANTAAILTGFFSLVVTLPLAWKIWRQNYYPPWPNRVLIIAGLFIIGVSSVMYVPNILHLKQQTRDDFESIWNN